MADFPDPVALRHPAMPGEIVIMSRLQLPTLAESGWVEAKSSEAKAALAAAQPTEDPTPTTGDES